MCHFICKLHTIIEKKFILFVLFCSFIISVFAHQTTKADQKMAKLFYTRYQHSIYWFATDENKKKAIDWLNIIYSENAYNSFSSKLYFAQTKLALSNSSLLDSADIKSIDNQVTVLVLNYLKNIQEGTVRFDYDEITRSHDSIYCKQIIDSDNNESVSKTIERIECKDADYLTLKRYLNDSIAANDTTRYKTVLLAMNYRKYFVSHPQSEYILVNIPTAEVEYYQQNKLFLKMRAVVGRKENPTRTIASYIRSIITLPFWNVPRSIALKELLPKIKKDSSYLRRLNFDVLDAKGEVVEDSLIHWKDYNATNFPYSLRQAKGSSNALGMIKFEMKNPYSIYLHATNLPKVFKKDKRFLSHGCIRLEKPFELADALLRTKIDITELKSEEKDKRSEKLKLPRKIPTFIIYLPLKLINNQLIFLDDIYQLIN